MFHSFLGTRKGCSATALAFSPKHSFLTVSLLGYLLQYSWASLVAQLVKNPPATWDTIPGLGRSPGEGKGYPLQYFGLENSMGYIVHGVAKSQTRLSDFHFHLVIFTDTKVWLQPWRGLLQSDSRHSQKSLHWVPVIVPMCLFKRVFVQRSVI